MKFFKWFAWSFVFGLVICAMVTENGVFAILAFIVWLMTKHFFDKMKVPGGRRGFVLQGIWILERHLRYVPDMKKWEELPVENGKNYFEFAGDQFRSGDFDNKHQQLPADFSLFSVHRDEILFDTDFLKNADWKWAIKKGKLELTGDSKKDKSQFIFHKRSAWTNQ